MELSPDDYDWTAPADVTKRSFDKIRKQANKELVEKRAAMRARIALQSVSSDAAKQARLAHPDAMDSKCAPTSAWIECILSAIFQGDVSEFQKSARVA